MNIIVVGVRPDAEKESQQTENEALGRWNTPVRGLGGAFQGSADSQADGFAESTEEAVSSGIGTPPWTVAPNGDTYRTSVESVGSGGIDDAIFDEEPFATTEAEEEYEAILDMAGLFVEEDSATGPFASVHVDPNSHTMGHIKAVKQLLGAVAEVLKRTMHSSRSRSIALTKLEEASMWAANGIANGE